MKISRERLDNESENTGFRPEILEKVFYLMDFLDALVTNEYLSSRIALKGGTALNLFCFEYPRLSVDIDVNYIGSADRDTMLAEQKTIQNVIEEIALGKNYRVQRKPNDHAGGKWRLRYQSAMHAQGFLEVDINFLARLPLWPVEKYDSFPLGTFQAKSIPVMDIHELCGSKLTALFSRHASRDLFDAHRIVTHQKLDIEKLRIAFLVYGGMSRTDWRIIHPDNIQFEWKEFQNMLLPMLRKKDISSIESPRDWANRILQECRTALSCVLPLHKNEQEFMDHLLEQGEIKPELICQDENLAQRIAAQPGLKWKALNVKKFKSGNQ